MTYIWNLWILLGAILACGLILIARYLLCEIRWMFQDPRWRLTPPETRADSPGPPCGAPGKDLAETPVSDPPAPDAPRRPLEAITRRFRERRSLPPAIPSKELEKLMQADAEPSKDPPHWPIPPREEGPNPNYIPALLDRVHRIRKEWQMAAGWHRIDQPPVDAGTNPMGYPVDFSWEGTSFSGNSKLEWVAQEFGGECVHVDSNVAGHATWLRGGRRFYYFDLPRGRGFWWTFLVTRVEPALLPTVQVRRRGGPTPFAALPALWPEMTGLPAFDGAHEIRRPAGILTTEPPVPETALSRYLELHTLHASAVLEADGHRCRVCIPELLFRGPELIRILQDACGVIEAAIAPYAGPAPESSVHGPLDVLRFWGDTVPTCRVCGEGVSGASVVCARCGTPHHEDCWRYTGGCAIYACLGRQGRSLPARADPASRAAAPDPS